MPEHRNHVGREDRIRQIGTFAKIPRQAGRFEELAATTVLDIDKPLPRTAALSSSS